MNRKGVCYDVGRVIAGENQRPDFDERIVRRELQIIRDDLHCTAVRICGQDVARVIAAAEMALSAGLEAWLSPELWEHDRAQVVDYLAGAARAAESVRQRWPGRVVLSVGSELTMFMRASCPATPSLTGSAVRRAWR